MAGLRESRRYISPAQAACCPALSCCFSDLPELIGITRCRILKMRVRQIILETHNYRFEVDQCHWRRPLIFYFSLFQLGVRKKLSFIAMPFDTRILGHIRPFCVLATRLVREQENAVVTFIVGPHVLEKTRTEVSRQFHDESSDAAQVRKRFR